jgi:hypothetical protein
MVYPPSGSLLLPKVNSGLSTQITIKVGVNTVGAIQQLTVNQNREMNVWEEIGTSGVVEIAPKGAAKIDLSVQRAVFDQMRVTEAFSRGFINLQAQRMPFNIEIIDKSDASSFNNILTHTCHNCWFKSYSVPYDANNFLIMENAGIVCEFITSVRGTTNAVLGGLRGIRYERDSIERSTDSFGIRGRFDSAGFSEQT